MEIKTEKLNLTKQLKIDMHTHIIPKNISNFLNKFNCGNFIRLKHNDDGTADMIQNNKFFRKIKENCWDENIRIQEYNQFNTSVQVVCTIPVMFSYWAKAKNILEFLQFLNDHLAELITRFPKQYVALGTIPMQDPDLAILELERIKKLNFKGIQIGSNINNLNLDNEKFKPIFKAIESLDLSILIHPWNMMGSKHIKKYWLPWLVGMPAEINRAICSFIFGGIFEQFPDLRVCFAHAGGSFFSTIGRIEHGFNSRPDLVAIDNNKNPREYYNKFWIDCITHDIDYLKYILKYQNSNKICFGTDYPFPLGDLEFGKFIENSNLDQKTIENIFCNSTLQWLKIKKEDFI